MTDEESSDAFVVPDSDSSLSARATDGSPDLNERTVAWDRIDWIACAVLVVVSVLLVGLHVRAYPTLSPIDELQHVDYVLKAGDFEIPRTNDLVGQRAMDEAACRGVDVSAYDAPSERRNRVAPRPTERGPTAPASLTAQVVEQTGPPVCGDPAHDPANFQENGVNTAAGQLPPYYVATGVVSRVITATGIVGSQVTTARLLGGLWAGAAWAVMWYAMSLLGVRRPQRAVVLTLLMATPLTLFHAATVNVDAVLMLTGAVALVAALLFEAGRLHGALLLVSYLLLYLIEPTVFLALCASAAYLVVRMTPRADIPTWKRLLPFAVFPMVLVLRLYVYRPFQRGLFPASPVSNRPTMYVDNALPTGGLEWDRVLAQLDANFLPITRAYVPPFWDEETTTAFIQLTNWLLIGTLVIAAFGFVRDRRVVWLARATIVTLLASGPFYTFSFAYFSDANFAAPGRFALPMIVFIVSVGAASLRTRSSMVVAYAIAAGTMLNTLALLVTA